MKESAKQRYERRRKEGVCTQCGKAPAAEGRVHCGPCWDKIRERQRANYRPRREKWQGCEETCPEYCPYKDCMRPSALCIGLGGVEPPPPRSKLTGAAVKQGTLHDGLKFYR